jgi:hypothetical protein
MSCAMLRAQIKRALPRGPSMSQQPGLFDRCIEIFRRRPGFYAAIASLPSATLFPALFWAIWFLTVRPAGPAPDLRAVFSTMTFNDKLEFLALFFLWITVPFAVAGRGLCRVASDQIAGRETSLRDAIADMASFIPSALLLGAVASTAAFIGAFFLVVPGFMAAAAFSLVVPAGAIEKAGPFLALRQGLSLVGKVFGRVLLLFFGYSLLIVATTVLQGALLSAALHIALVRVAIIVMCSALPLVPLALLNIALTLLYLEARTPAPSVGPAAGT